MKLTSKQAYELLISGLDNPETILYVPHSRQVGNLSGLIAKEIGKDDDYARTLGYLHDIGRKINCDNHIYAGYKYLMDEGYEDYAHICLTHSFLNNDMECICASLLPADSEGYSIVKEFVENRKNTVYDKIVQLCDLLCLHTGGTTLENRIRDVEVRRGTHYKSKYHYETALAQKREIEDLLGHSVYDLYKFL